MHKRNIIEMFNNLEKLLKFHSTVKNPLLDVGSLSTKEVEKFNIDASGETYSSWVDLRKSLQSQFKKRIDFEHRLRTALNEIDNECYSRFRIFSHKSMINCIIFNHLG